MSKKTVSQALKRRLVLEVGILKEKRIKNSNYKAPLKTSFGGKLTVNPQLASNYKNETLVSIF